MIARVILVNPDQHQPDARGAIAGAPWSLRIAAWAWGAAGFIFAFGPLLTALLLWLQYSSIRRNAYRIADLAEVVDTTDTIDLAPFIAEFERIEAWALNASGWLVTVVLLLYLVAAAAILAAYLIICRYTGLGANSARVLGTVLALLSSTVAAMVWQVFAAISWLPVDALWANHLGLVLIALHTTGIVLVWIPASNTFVRAQHAPSRALA